MKRRLFISKCGNHFIPFSGPGEMVGQVAEKVVVLVVLIHMYVAGSVLQCPSPVQVAVMVILGNKPLSQVKVMDDPSNVVV